MVTAVAAFSLQAAQAELDGSYQVRYAANLGSGTSVINISNTGALGAGLASQNSAHPAATVGAICANVYAFSPDEQMISCCSCAVTPNGLQSLDVKVDLATNTLTPAPVTSVVIKLLATKPIGNSCDNSAASVTAANLATGMVAWATTVHAVNGTFGVTETAFTPATLSIAPSGATGDISEIGRLGQLCNFIIANGSSYGQCRNCRLGGLGAVRQ